MSPFKKVTIIALGSVEKFLEGSASGDETVEKWCSCASKEGGRLGAAGTGNPGVVSGCFEILAFLLLNYFPNCPTVPSCITWVLNCMKWKSAKK